MPHRSGGRHRQQPPRHRVPRRSAAPPANSARGRALALSATLCAALLTGTAGRDAAAAHPHHDATPSPPSPAKIGPSTGLDTDGDDPAAETTGTTTTDLDSNSPEIDNDDLRAATRTQAEAGGVGAAAGPIAGLESGIGLPWEVLGGEVLGGETEDAPSAVRAGAVAVRRKPRPTEVLFVVGGGAWVNPNPTAMVTSCFGPRWGRQHEGVDLAAADGSPILAAGAGVVVRAGAAEGYGNAVLIDHGDGYLTHYGHLATIAVRAGQQVRAGERIGDEGSTGHSTGPHLHFEVHRGTYKNPVEPTLWMHEHGVDIRGCGTF